MLKLGDAPMHPKKYSRRLKHLSLGCPHASPSPSTFISSSFSTLYFYHFMRYVLCLERLTLYFLVCFLLLAVHTKLEPSLHCVGEKHAPLHPITQHRFSCL